MTTEILRNTLFNKQIQGLDEKNTENAARSPILTFNMDFETELAAVVFDEVHYIGDEDRGSVWEQSILMLPNHIQLIMLSATIDKPEKFASWVENQKAIRDGENQFKEVYLCSTLVRVVPLKHYMWLTCHQNNIKEAKGTPLETDLKQGTNKPILISEESQSPFQEANYYKIMKLKRTD